MAFQLKYTQPFPPTPSESAATTSLISSLKLLSHPEGGYFVQTDKSYNHIIPNPFLTSSPRDPFAQDTSTNTKITAVAGDTRAVGEKDETRAASTTIFYLLSSMSPKGHFHRNKARTMHLHHRGRARYVILHADEWDGTPGTCRIEDWVVGENVEGGERLQWMVEGGKYKASYLLPGDAEEKESGEGVAGCLISEVVVPGFEFTDHDFLTWDRLVLLVGEKSAEEMKWLVHKD
ncbi:hypothetical protein H072_6945 [Dactylellina haptotyla CBS 200.50]|uniref:DUF985 domain-containing protein n=1 Tax=Dactylellina haptotyla (strain CBS 200.50) TaxID=1284197 RepID=S8BVI2_DACHA|nr:hypothetical protein H072_6945 [Dactylellina haptotyla CBS 200.50]